MLLNDFVIGGIGGIVSRSITAPLELYKIQRQNSFMPNSTINAVIEKEGIRYLWKGNGVNCLRIFPQNAINYCIYSFCDGTLFSNIKNDNSRRFISGTISGASSMILTYPLETIRTRLSLQTKTSHYSSIFQLIRKVPMRELFLGLRMSIIGYAPFTAISFASYFKYKEIMEKYIDINPVVCKIIAGAASGGTAITITYPSDLIRRRLQLQNFDKNVPKYHGIIHCITKIVSMEGFCGLYRGLPATYIKILPTIGIQFLVIDYLKNG